MKSCEAHLWCLGVEDVHRVSAAGYSEDWSVVEVLRELLSIERGAGNQQLDVRPEARNVLHLLARHKPLHNNLNFEVENMSNTMHVITILSEFLREPHSSSLRFTMMSYCWSEDKVTKKSALSLSLQLISRG